MKVRNQIFISYSHKDKRWQEMLCTNLKPLIRSGEIKLWDDTHIKPGSLWREEIETALATARAAVLLVSPAFLASEFICEHELPRLLEAAKGEGLKILWLAVSWSTYKDTEIVSYQALNDPERPLAAFSRAQRDKALVDICEQIKKECAWEELPGRLLAAAEVAETSLSARKGLEALIKLMSDAAVRGDVGKFEAHFHSSAKQIRVLGYYKDLHDQLHTFQLQSYQRLVALLEDVKKSPDDSSTWENAFELHEMPLRQIQRGLEELADPEDVSQRRVCWVPKLIYTLRLLSKALMNRDATEMEKVLETVGRVVRVQLDRLNCSLIEAASGLPLAELVESLSSVCDHLDGSRADPGTVASLKNGVTDLGRLKSTLDSLIEQHDKWQALDTELMRVEAEGFAALKGSWPNLKMDTEAQCEGLTEEWARSLAQYTEKVEQAIAAKEPNQIREPFRAYRSKVNHQFYEVDWALKDLCKKLASESEPLAKVLEMIK